ncbi:damage-inducible protein CinA [Sulfitobacter alexandrii]|uniref:Damage-inducible protein CinA n=1 Tax=Sulfitobacter alexandrii TaxID=1917485 RepID=A0A1J0WG49_9RHOB|nr:CinA family protein [Sulfitobacter alexandrii]APE43316.1 damage-inducible protein CinA [Sulfitobacter alexandrii]
MSIAAQILELARTKGVMIACAESCTGGLVAAALTELPGSSMMFDRGFVTYTNAAKTALLGVKPGTLHMHGAVSEEVAKEMATGALAGSDAGLAVSITGIAGPGGSDNKPEGRVCFGLASGIQVWSVTQEFGALGRSRVRTAARDYAQTLLLEGLHTLP